MAVTFTYALLLSQCLFILQALASFPCLHPDDLGCMREHHRIHQIADGRHPAGPLVSLFTYEKAGIKPPEWLAQAAAKTSETGSINGSDYGNDILWKFPITVGNSELKVVFDTSSGDFWTFSTITPKSEQGNHSLYNVSTGRRDGNQHFKLQYPSGSASGPEYVDSVKVGSLTTSMDVGAATKVAKVFQRQPIDGFVGFALMHENTCKPTKCFSFFHQIQPQLAQPLFAVALRHDGPGTFDFGFIDKSLYTGTITYSRRYNYNQQGAWGAYIQGYQVGNHPKQNSPFEALIDTGTTLVYLPDPVFTDYYSDVPGATLDFHYGGVVFPCSSTSKVPQLSFKIGGQYRTMLGGEYGVFKQINRKTCFGTVQNGDFAGAAILGDAFMRSQYVVYDVGNDRIGFAQQAGIEL